ncbi:unnamed protein product [Notodromas monacha]|uniref:Major facilitator superfamily (MFS) profile domain-containing protein n=1 Tax=Notodromas monacha TaxID=399045 RepID=A0A7R9GI38_9CRUS|nr:unnamed protein product [Notodromas monacha]CAG0923456.1 unnamed protein product [Notodromas monacha]
MKWNQKFWTPRPSLTKDEIIKAEFSVGLVPSSRFGLALVCLLTMMNLFLLRTHFNFAMVCMVKQSTPDYEAIDQNIVPESQPMIPSSTMTTNPGRGKENLFGDSDPLFGLRLKDESERRVVGLRSLLVVDENGDTDNMNSAGFQCSENYPAEKLSYEGEFEWTRPMQGTLFGSFYYGYISSMVIGGMIGDLVSAKWLMLFGTSLTGLLTLAVPGAARMSPHALVAVRAVQGIISGMSVPCVHQLVASWSSPTERPVLMGLAYSGVSLGYALSSPFASFFCSSSSTGWPWIFYVSGIWSCLCTILVYLFVYDSPAQHPRISQEEKEYLLTVAPHSQEKRDTEKHKIPWAKLLTSLPFIAICVCHFCINWGFYVLAIMLPTYMRDVLKFDVRENGMLSALPYIGTAAIQLTMGRPIDWVRRNRKLSITTIRKVCNTFGMGAPALALLTLGSVGCAERYFGVALTIAAQSLLGVCFVAGFFVNHADLAPRYAGTMMGITNTVGNIQGFLAPQLTTLLTPNGTREEWLVVFYIGAFMYLFGAGFFLFFGSGELQPWATLSNHGLESGSRGNADTTSIRARHPSSGAPEEQDPNGPISADELKARLNDAIVAAGMKRSNSSSLAGGDTDLGAIVVGGGGGGDDDDSTVCRRLSRSHLKPMVPDSCEGFDEKGW